MQDKKAKNVSAIVLSRSGNKSVKVAVDYRVKHPKYGKYTKGRTILMVHDELNQAGVGDVVEIAECRPYSKTKRWRLVNVASKVIVE